MPTGSTGLIWRKFRTTIVALRALDYKTVPVFFQWCWKARFADPPREDIESLLVKLSVRGSVQSFPLVLNGQEVRRDEEIGEDS